jgi:F-box and WD-40 domain protein 1/11
MSSAFRLDEGFSEDTRSQAGSELLPARAELDQDISTTGDLQVPEWLLAMTESDRSGKPTLFNMRHKRHNI